MADITADITKREREVLEMICNELSAAEIAGKLYLSVRTVEGHRNNLILKTGCRNTAGLVLFAVKAGIFSLDL
ncbi:LuxR C-terminal-related transcriptional regulator [Pedobacter sp. P26]|uniref:LuxR C-terminal-related transcriptional regulator n=1 Tax=Pedobacter sp. P26 TaxID=3423956 RepID=UPI003D66FF4E